ncbi:MAG: ABC transporter permease [Pseudolabrys sp.]
MPNLVPTYRRLWLFLSSFTIVAFLAIPVLIVIPMSFSGKRFLEFPPETWSLRWYERLFESSDWIGAFGVSLTTATLTALIATPLGIAAGYAIHAGAKSSLSRFQVVILLPLLVPHIILAVGIFYIYVKLDIIGSIFGLVAAHTMLALPFTMVTTLTGLRTFDMTQEIVARSMGASRLYAFRVVTLPQIKASVLSGALFAFVTSLDEVIVSLFIATGLNQTITKVMFGSVQNELDPTVAAVSTVLISASVLLGSLGILARRLAVTARMRAG